MTDPLNGVIVASHIRDVLVKFDPAHAEQYNANFDTFERDVHSMLDRLEKELEPYRGTRVVVYHKAWPYFLNRFHLVEAGAIEPKPDIPPGPQHIIDVEQLIKDQHVRVIIVDTFNPIKVGEKIAKKTNVSAVVLASDVHGINGADDYISLFETNIHLLIEAIQKTDAMSDTSPSSDG